MLKLSHKLLNFSRIEKINGKLIYVSPGVFNPKISLSSVFLAKNLEVREGDYVLDLGCGTGIQAVFAAEKARKVVATDVNPLAVKCTWINALINGVAGKVEVRLGDLFEPVKGEVFDLIIFNPPYLPVNPQGDLDRAWAAGANLELLKRFLAEVASHMHRESLLEVVFSTLSNLNWFLKGLRRAGLKPSIAKVKRLPFEKLVLIKARPRF